MEWENLMKQFADLVGRALARRLLTQRLASENQLKEATEGSTGKEEESARHDSERTDHECDRV
jgi:hypothetical protein